MVKHKWAQARLYVIHSTIMKAKHKVTIYIHYLTQLVRYLPPVIQYFMILSVCAYFNGFLSVCFSIYFTFNDTSYCHKMYVAVIEMRVWNLQD